jgi:hypothetical protein
MTRGKDVYHGTLECFIYVLICHVSVFHVLQLHNKLQNNRHVLPRNVGQYLILSSNVKSYLMRMDKRDIISFEFYLGHYVET